MKYSRCKVVVSCIRCIHTLLLFSRALMNGYQFTAILIFTKLLRKIQFKVNETMKNFDSEYYDMLLNYNPYSICKLYDCMKNIAVHICSFCIFMDGFVI